MHINRKRYRGDREAIRALVQPDRVHRDVYLDPELFEIEMEELFTKTWVYVGHESQVPEPGDYFATDDRPRAGTDGAAHRRRSARATQPLRAQGDQTRQ